MGGGGVGLKPDLRGVDQGLQAVTFGKLVGVVPIRKDLSRLGKVMPRSGQMRGVGGQRLARKGKVGKVPLRHGPAKGRGVTRVDNNAIREG